MKPLACLILCLAATACAPLHMDGPDACGASGYQTLVGVNVAAVTLPADLKHRIIRPGDVVTQDYRAGRLNIRTDENGQIVSVSCG